MGAYEEAIASHVDATACEGDVDETWLNIGMIHRAQFRLEEAKDAFERALEISPDYPAASMGLADVKGAIELMARIRALKLEG
jgi:tetratricopeptide (TPR) repeat protein